MRVVGLRIFLSSDDKVWVDSFTLERMYPLGGDPGAGTPLTRKFWKKISNGRKIGVDVKYVAMPHHVPGHWCLVVADFVKQLIIYYDSYLGAKYATGAAHHIRRWLQEECDSQGFTDCRPANFVLVTWTSGPLQTNAIDCGVCVLSMVEILAVDGPDAFYRKAACAETDTDSKHWAALTIARQRAKWGCYAYTHPNGIQKNEMSIMVNNDQALCDELIDITDD